MKAIDKKQELVNKKWRQYVIDAGALACMIHDMPDKIKEQIRGEMLIEATKELNKTD